MGETGFDLGSKLLEAIIVTLTTLIITAIITGIAKTTKNKFKQKFDEYNQTSRKIEYKRRLKIRYNKFTLHLFSTIACAIYFVLSAVLYEFSLKVYVKEIIELYNPLAEYIYIGSLLFLVLTAIVFIISEIINTILSKYGLKNKHKFNYIFFILLFMMFEILLLYFLDPFINSMKWVEELKNLYVLINIIILDFLGALFYINLVRNKSNTSYNSINNVVFHIDASKYYGYYKEEIFCTNYYNTLLLSDNVILPNGIKNNDIYSNYNVITTETDFCIVNKHGGILRKISKDDIIYIEFLNEENKCVLRFDEKRIYTIGFTYTEKLI